MRAFVRRIMVSTGQPCIAMRLFVSFGSAYGWFPVAASWRPSHEFGNNDGPKVSGNRRSKESQTPRLPDGEACETGPDAAKWLSDATWGQYYCHWIRRGTPSIREWPLFELHIGLSVGRRTPHCGTALRSWLRTSKRARAVDLVEEAKIRSLLNARQVRAIGRLRRIRNDYAHFRGFDRCDSHFQRSVEHALPPFQLLAKDAASSLRVLADIMSY